MVSLLRLSELMEVIAGDKGHPREGAPEPTKPAHRGSPARGETWRPWHYSGCLGRGAPLSGQAPTPVCEEAGCPW